MVLVPRANIFLGFHESRGIITWDSLPTPCIGVQWERNLMHCAWLFAELQSLFFRDAVFFCVRRNWTALAKGVKVGNQRSINKLSCRCSDCSSERNYRAAVMVGTMYSKRRIRVTKYILHTFLLLCRNGRNDFRNGVWCLELVENSLRMFFLHCIACNHLRAKG